MLWVVFYQWLFLIESKTPIASLVVVALAIVFCSCLLEQLARLRAALPTPPFGLRLVICSAKCASFLTRLPEHVFSCNGLASLSILPFFENGFAVFSAQARLGPGPP